MTRFEELQKELHISDEVCELMRYDLQTLEKIKSTRELTLLYVSFDVVNIKGTEWYCCSVHDKTKELIFYPFFKLREVDNKKKNLEELMELFYKSQEILPLPRGKKGYNYIAIDEREV